MRRFAAPLLAVLSLAGGASAAPTDCRALVACQREFDGVLGAAVYRCYKADGQRATPATPRAPDCPNLAQLEQAYSVCRFHQPLKPEALGPLGLLLDFGRLPASICYNIDRRIGYLSLDTGTGVFRQEHAPAGGNARGTIWQLQLPANTDALRIQQYPFLGCRRFRASAYCQWQFQIRRRAHQTLLQVSDIAQPCQPSFRWQDVFEGLRQNFRACPATPHP